MSQEKSRRETASIMRWLEIAHMAMTSTEQSVTISAALLADVCDELLYLRSSPDSEMVASRDKHYEYLRAYTAAREAEERAGAIIGERGRRALIWRRQVRGLQAAIARRNAKILELQAALRMRSDGTL